MTPEQEQIVRDKIAATPAMSEQPNNTDGSYEIARLFNLEFDPIYYVWRTDVSAQTVEENGFIWAQVDNLGGGKARIWSWLRERNINAGKPNVRVGINQAFTADSALWNAVRLHLSRPASVIEQLLTFGNGNGAGQGIPLASDDKPRRMGYEGPISYQEIHAIRNP